MTRPSYYRGHDFWGNSKPKLEFEAAIMLFGVTLGAIQDVAPVAVFTFVPSVVAGMEAYKESRAV